MMNKVHMFNNSNTGKKIHKNSRMLSLSLKMLKMLKILKIHLQIQITINNCI